MRRVALGLLVLFAAGCAKKPAKPTAAPAESQPAETAGGGFGDTFAGGFVSAVTQPPADPPPATGNRGNTTYRPGAGVVQNVRGAAVRTVAINEVKQLGIFIEQKYTEDGRMPGKDETLSYIERDARKIHQAITDGDIILTGTRDHGGLWAYEIDADKRGGIVLVGGVASRATAEEVKKLLGK